MLTPSSNTSHKCSETKRLQAQGQLGIHSESKSGSHK